MAKRETGRDAASRIEELSAGERLGEGAPRPLEPLEPPGFGSDEQATEALDTASRGAELPARYDVRESLGREDCGDLFRVYDRELDREVVLKVLREDAPPRAEEQLRDDARRLARIGHPGVVGIFDLGTLPDGRLFVTRERVEGRPLGRWAHQVEARRVMRWMVAVTDTVAAAQRAGVLHLRLEPASVLVGRVVKVVGYGSGVAEPSAFMAPELVRGEGGGTTADVYSIGAIALDVLGGRVLPGLEAILTRATAVAPSDRHASAEALLAELEDWLDAG